MQQDTTKRAFNNKHHSFKANYNNKQQPETQTKRLVGGEKTSTVFPKHVGRILDSVVAIELLSSGKLALFDVSVL